MKAITDLMKEMQKSIDEKTTTEKKEDGISEVFPEEEGEEKKHSKEGWRGLDGSFWKWVQDFDGQQSTWNTWNFQFKTAVGSANPMIRKILELVPKIGRDNDWDFFFHDLEGVVSQACGVLPTVSTL